MEIGSGYLGLLSVLFLIVVPSGCLPEKISCFVCTSRNSSYKECEDPFDAGVSNYVNNCKVSRGHGEIPANLCVKIIGVAYPTNEKIVIRRCTSETLDEQCGTFRLGDDLIKGCIFTCNLDGCNPANNLQHSQPLMLTMIGLFLILWINL